MNGEPPDTAVRHAHKIRIIQRENKKWFVHCDWCCYESEDYIRELSASLIGRTHRHQHIAKGTW